jgi:hypothetical protein
MPDEYPPELEATEFPEGHQCYGTTGQVFEVRDGRWVLIKRTMAEINAQPPPRHYLKAGQKREPWDK